MSKVEESGMRMSRGGGCGLRLSIKVILYKYHTDSNHLRCPYSIVKRWFRQGGVVEMLHQARSHLPKV